ncbi:ATP-dependent DNA helicase II [Melanomma pulvis-pyrius CBS 109.77]|uniref:ATP-dependent DNA helicase II subunit 2 n=1 Tax=Melanomma pulvis-pyrius CBS 109.77 TaxID=1314802 RepID=A0A6A6XPK8_9PLEO|nr:ATP-dependent DNA helicase II [Melanomma pulvis-pyrius CBS 109.77]
MASKEATVYVLDLGRSMGQKQNGRSKTNLDWAMEYVWDKITTTVATGRKTALMGVVGARTDETDLDGIVDDDAEGYSNTRVFSNLKQFLLPDIRHLQEHLKPSSTDEGDLLSALAIAIEMINKGTCGKNGNPLKFDRRIIIVTDGQGYMDSTDLDQIAAKLKADKFELVLLGVDFDDPESGFKEEDKDPHKEENETVLKEFIDNCDGIFGTLAEAISQMDIPRLKETRPVPSYRGELTLGAPTIYDATMTIDVERYPCTMIAKPPTASAFAVRTDLGSAPGASAESSATVAGEGPPADGQLSAVRNQRVYQVDKPDEPGVKMNVEMEDLEKGYEYGRTAVHISESEFNVVKLETTAAFELIGFIRADKFDRYLAMSRANHVVAQKGNDKAQLALSALTHALFEADCYAIARLVAKDNKAPVVVLLVPRLEGEVENLIEVELPFEEDMRRYKFPPLDKKLTITGKVITEHKDLPNDNLMAAMSDYVDAMDLSTLGEDGEEYMKPEDTYSPLLHRINHVIRWRATNNIYTTLPDPPQILTKYSAPPAELLKSTERELDALKAAADVKKVPPKQKGRGKRSLKDREKPLSGLDVDELLGNPKRVKIDSGNLIPSFKQALASTDDLDAIQAAADEMGNSIRTYISSSVGESGYGRALEALRVMRDEITELEEPEIYNSFVRALKSEILEGKLKGDRREMWWRIRGSKYGLVDRKRSFASEVTEEEAAEFYKG